MEAHHPDIGIWTETCSSAMIDRESAVQLTWFTTTSQLDTRGDERTNRIGKSDDSTPTFLDYQPESRSYEMGTHVDIVLCWHCYLVGM